MKLGSKGILLSFLEMICVSIYTLDLASSTHELSGLLLPKIFCLLFLPINTWLRSISWFIFRMLVPIVKVFCFSDTFTCFINDSLFVWYLLSIFLLYFSSTFLEDSDLVENCLVIIVWGDFYLLKDRVLCWYAVIISGGYRIEESLSFFGLDSGWRYPSIDEF